MARVSILFAKLSILLLYLRVFFPTGAAKSNFWWVIQATIWLNVLYTTAYILLVSLQCVPSKQPWGHSCIDESALLITASVINIISDVAVVVIPLGSVWNLQMARKKKRALWALFGFGLLAPGASVARLSYQIVKFNSRNETVNLQITAHLAATEQVIAIVAGCLPVISTLWIQRRQQPPNPPSSYSSIEGLGVSGDPESGNVAIVERSYKITTDTGGNEISTPMGNTSISTSAYKSSGR